MPGPEHDWDDLLTPPDLKQRLYLKHSGHNREPKVEHGGGEVASSPETSWAKRYLELEWQLHVHIWAGSQDQPTYLCAVFEGDGLMEAWVHRNDGEGLSSNAREGDALRIERHRQDWEHSVLVHVVKLSQDQEGVALQRHRLADTVAVPR